MQSGATTFGLDERLERVLVYAISVVVGLFYPLAWLPGLIVYFVEKNRNVRWHGLQAAAVFGTLSILLALVNLVRWLLHGIPLLGFFTSIGLGLLGGIVWWVMILLGIWLVIMVWFRPAYRLPFIGSLLNRWM